MKTIELNGETFEVVNDYTKQAESIKRTAYRWCDRWEDVYSRPSRTKEEIKEYWEKFINEVDGIIHGYTGNSFTFCIYGEVTYYGDRCIVQITPTHNRIIIDNT